MSRVILTIEHNGVRTTREFDSGDSNAAGEAFAKAMHDADLTWPMFTTVVDAMIDFMPLGENDPLVEPVSLVLRGCEGIDERLQAMRSLVRDEIRKSASEGVVLTVDAKAWANGEPGHTLGEAMERIGRRAGERVADRRRDFVCKVCSATPDEDGCVRHGKGCFALCEQCGGEEYVG